jgi:molybdopterin-synthase adenylyltransferase
MIRQREGNPAVERLSAAQIVLCGAGAVGSNLADTLARQGAARLRVIDFDRVEERNVANQLYTLEDVGAFKVEALRHQLFRAAGVEIEAVPKELTDRNARKLLAGADLVIDGFDRSASRRLVTQVCAAEGLPCLHVGLSADYAEVLWNQGYRVPADPLARGLVLLAVTIAAESVTRYLAGGVREGWTATLRDFAVRSA